MSNQRLPKFVFQSRNAFWYKPWLGRVDGKQKWGRTIRLADDTVPMSELWTIYEQLGSAPKDTVGWMLDLYVGSPQFEQLKPKTQKEYKSAVDKIRNKSTGSGKLGDARLTRVTKRTIRDYLDTYPAPIAANRHCRAEGGLVVRKRYEIPENPKSVKLNREEAATVTDDEYETALRMAPPRSNR